ncbi:colipase isoform X1 [Phyllobates terribilis]|uniref:colipase isoform X1 n=1 Tax=Phyllobates terribilis TaxID=111132 RepID=UPI003CCB44EB
MIQHRFTIALLFVCLLLCCDVAQSGLLFNLDNGELCLQSAQCKSNCCHRESGVSLSRCAPKAAETQKCSPLHLYGVYYYCPCESGLTCEVDRSIIGTITNTDFGYCKDPNDAY